MEVLEYPFIYAFRPIAAVKCVFVCVFYCCEEMVKTVCLFPSGIMAVPPAYSDLGKSAKDIFNKGYGKSTT